MNICFTYITPFHPNKGGIGRVTDSLTREFQKRGHKVWYLIYDVTSRHEYDYPAPLTYLPSKELLSSENVDSYHKFLINNDIDIIINQSGNFGDSRLWLNKGDSKAKIISVVHTPPIVNLKYFWEELILLRGPRLIDRIKLVARCVLYRKLKNRELRERIEQYKYLLPRTDKVCTLSKYFYPEIDFLCPGYEDKYCAINNPNSYSSTDVAELPKKQNLIVWVGLFSEQKRPTQTIKIWEKICRQFPDWTLIIVGYNKKHHWAERMYDLAKGIENIKFTGFDNPFKYQSCAKIAILTSSYEGWGMVLTEAMQCGAVPVAFDSFASIRDIIQDRENGLLVKPFNSKDFADKLKFLMTHSDELDRMSQNARKSVHRFDIEQIADQWNNLFYSLQGL